MRTLVKGFPALSVIMILFLPCFLQAGVARSHEDTGCSKLNLRSDEIILEYLVTDSMLRINAISRETQVSSVQSLDPLFWRNLNAFKDQLRSADIHDFSKSAVILYLFLVKPVQACIKGMRRLIIIPDERLSDLPFEAIISDEYLPDGKQRKNLHYLIWDFEIVYRYPAVCRDDLAEDPGDGHFATTDDHRYAFVGFYPESKNITRLPDLHGAKQEIEGIHTLFDRKGLPSCCIHGDHVGKERFKAVASLGRIVHLATHYLPEKEGNACGGFVFANSQPAGSNGHDPDDLLTRDELESMGLRSDLIVLSACASGVGGQSKKLDGNSLPQILCMGGARNILSTLWNVTDNLADEFMLDFYRSWLSGKPYSEALREVKLNWISCRATAIPTIWAPYVLMGE